MAFKFHHSLAAAPSSRPGVVVRHHFCGSLQRRKGGRELAERPAAAQVLAQLSLELQPRHCPSVWSLSWGRGRHQAGGVGGRHTVTSYRE